MPRFSLISLAGCVSMILGLTACQTLEPVATRPVAEPMAPAPAPEVSIGKTLVYVHEDGKRVESSITAVGKDGTVTWESSDDWVVTVIHPFAGYVAWKGPDDEGTQRFTGDSMFPLQVGKTMRTAYSGESTTEESWSGKRVCEVKSQEAIDVQAGTFDTYKVVCKQGSNPNSPARTRTFYYSPKVGASVLTVHQIHYKNRNERRELIDYHASPADAAES